MSSVQTSSLRGYSMQTNLNLNMTVPRIGLQYMLVRTTTWVIERDSNRVSAEAEQDARGSGFYVYQSIVEVFVTAGLVGNTNGKDYTSSFEKPVQLPKSVYGKDYDSVESSSKILFVETIEMYSDCV